jgi:hypothetical protein
LRNCVRKLTISRIRMRGIVEEEEGKKEEITKLELKKAMEG